MTRNPWRLDRTSGGSSGGAAAAVAAGLRSARAGHRRGRIDPGPGVVLRRGRPQADLRPRPAAPGFFPPSWGSLAHTGPIGRTVADVALLLGVIAGYDARDGASLPVCRAGFDAAVRPCRLRSASPPTSASPLFDPTCARRSSRRWTPSELGAHMIPGRCRPRPRDPRSRPPAHRLYRAGGRRPRSAIPALLQPSDPDYRGLVGRTDTAAPTTSSASHRRTQCAARFLDLSSGPRLLVTPTVAATAFGAGTLGAIGRRSAGRSHLGWSPFSWPINLTGLPATLPCGFDPDGFPIGLQIIGPWLQEAGASGSRLRSRSPAPRSHTVLLFRAARPPSVSSDASASPGCTGFPCPGVPDIRAPAFFRAPGSPPACPPGDRKVRPRIQVARPSRRAGPWRPGNSGPGRRSGEQKVDLGSGGSSLTRRRSAAFPG